MSDKDKQESFRICMAQDEEVQAAIRNLSGLMDRKQYDFIMVISERMSRDDVPSGRFQEGMSVISYKSEAPVLPAILFGVAQRNKDFERFITDLFRMVMNLGRKVTGKLMQSSPPDGLAN